VLQQLASQPALAEHLYWTSLGDQTEAAMKVAALKSGLRENYVEMDYPRIHEIPFDGPPQAHGHHPPHAGRGGDRFRQGGAARGPAIVHRHPGRGPGRAAR